MNVYNSSMKFDSFKKTIRDMGSEYDDVPLFSLQSISKGYYGEWLALRSRMAWRVIVNAILETNLSCSAQACLDEAGMACLHIAMLACIACATIGPQITSDSVYTI